MRLDSKTAIVTGGGSGFGAGIARVFAREGAQVMVADIDGDAAAQVAGENGGIAQQADVSDGVSVAAMTQAALDAWGRIDILVNNAGITHLPAPMEEVTEADFDRVLAVNVKSVYLTAREIVPRMKAAGSGAILNIASTAGLSPRPRLNWYNASKGWMITATKTMAVELAPRASASTRSAPWLAKRRFSKASWARTRRKSGRSSCRRSRSAASPHRRTWARPRPSCAPTRPR
jgi:3-oxoacyl-[acyl-carrier protein] reductase